MLMDALADSGVADDTVIVYTSDHGEMLGKFGMWWKCSLYEDSVRVPLIVAGSDFGRGQRVATPVDLLDLQATLFHATGAQRPADWVGQPLQTIPENDRDRVVFSEYHAHGTRSGAYLIRKGIWKLIHSMEAPAQLFNLKDDPDELNNQFEREPVKARELEAALRRICSPEKENEKAHAFEERQLEKLKAMRA
jgi:choline-sulfatase